MKTEQPLQELAQIIGIEPSYEDVAGRTHRTSSKTRKSFLEALAIDTESPEGLKSALDDYQHRQWHRWIEPVKVIRLEDLPLTVVLTFPQQHQNEHFQWKLAEETGAEYNGEFVPDRLRMVASRKLEGHLISQYELELHLPLEQGYHQLTISGDHNGQHRSETMLLVVTPSLCYLPPALRDENNLRTWGLALQLYALRSKRNWGMGDFTDLVHAVDLSAEMGAGVVGLNPLHTLFPQDPEKCSPYSPSTRLGINIMYIDVEAVPDFAECDAARHRVLAPEFQQRLAELREAPMVPYQGVGELKLPVLDTLYQHFRSRHLKQNSDRAQAFWRFVEQSGQSLLNQSLYEALQEHFYRDDSRTWGWPVWPEAYRDPKSPAVSEFAEANRERIEFYQYLQWLANEQLANAAKRSLDKGLPVGLYMDLAVGIDRGGAEAWANQELYALDLSVGCPPDICNLKGQDWGLPPMIPSRLYEQGYRQVIETFRYAMGYAGALRIDHFMMLMRLFWIPPGCFATQGAYVRYPFDDLLGILALESHRNRCLIIGEDLGTVPKLVRQRMQDWGIYSYKVLLLEKDENEEFLRPHHYPAHALVAFSTHDLPTLSGFWAGQNIEVRNQLDLFPTKAAHKRQVKEHVMERWSVLAGLERENLLPEGVTTDPATVPVMTPELSRAIQQYIARTPCKLQMVQMEDIFGQVDQMNLPGTVDQYPNWRRKMLIDLEGISADDRFKAMCSVLSHERGALSDTLPVASTGTKKKTLTDIPGATYRFQFNHHFTFDQAQQLVEYLYRLGITHCYASPLLASRRGSTHGYDIIEHHQLNPEVGSREDFNRFVETLKSRNMGMILDVVPNHMGIGQDNAWWMDVLENGHSSIYSGYFDIDWSPLKDELYGKVLLPVLGKPYGQILEDGELSLTFDQDQGRLTLHYYEHFWPINPRSYPLVLNYRVDVLESRLGHHSEALMEYQSIISAFERLPVHSERDAARREERLREKTITRKRLAQLCKASPQITEFVAENLNDFNTMQNNPANQNRMHQLLEAQAYRLAYWRVASDEINYRRFFDINDLAGVCVEDPRVFHDTHQLLLELVEQQLVTGFRIDHPDGLFNPTRYFQQLQTEAAERLKQDDWSPDDPMRYPLYVAVEKILEPYERLPKNWMVHGTTGYDFMNAVNHLMVAHENEKQFNRIYQRFTRFYDSFKDLVYHCKLLIMRVSMASELNVLSHQLNIISEANWQSRDFTLNNLRRALAEVTACFPVYRAYVNPEGASKSDRHFIEWAVNMAKKRSPAFDLTVFDFISDVLLQEFGQEASPDYREAVLWFAMKFQQFTGPVMAKGVEDTSFYRYNRLASLCEVGGEPYQFGISPSAFHQQNLERFKHWPHTLLSTSTHDTKRSEDVRARLNVLSEMPETWQGHLARWASLSKVWKTELEGQFMPDRNDEYLIYQTLVGMWPLEMLHQVDEAGLESIKERAEAYMLKAVREAKVHTSWINANQEYEDALSQFIGKLLSAPDKNGFLKDLLTLVPEVAWYGMLNSLSQTLLKLTVPGVPDIYQGTEIWDFSLVDPDNRRPVNYDHRHRLLNDLEPLLSIFGSTKPANRQPALADMLTHMEDGRIKLFITALTLRFRQQNLDLFKLGNYQPLDICGTHQKHAVGFARSLEDKTLIVITPRLMRTRCQGHGNLPLGTAVWEDTYLLLPEGFTARKLLNLFTYERLPIQDRQVPLAQIFSQFPVALLLAVGEELAQ